MEAVWEPGSTVSFFPVQCGPELQVWLSTYLQVPSCPAGLWGVCWVLCAPKNCKTNRRHQHKFHNTCPWGNCCRKAGPSLKSFSWLLFVIQHNQLFPCIHVNPSDIQLPFSYNSRGGQMPRALRGHRNPRTSTRRCGLHPVGFWTPLKFKKYTRPASWSSTFFMYLQNNRHRHRYSSSCKTEVKEPSKPQELTSQSLSQSIWISIAQVTRLQFLLQGLELLLHLQKVTTASIYFDKNEPGSPFLLSATHCSFMAQNWNQRKAKIHLLAAADFFARKNISTLLFFGVF